MKTFCIKMAETQFLYGRISGSQTSTVQSPQIPFYLHGFHTFNEYHLQGLEGLCMPLFRMCVVGGANSCSGIFSLAFLVFSNFAPSSVEPFSPQ